MSDKNLNDINSCYIHIPFCIKKCSYCDFYSIEDLSLQQEYTQSLLKEIRLRAESIFKKSNIDTIYLGGGTPSTLSIDLLEQILSELYKNFKISTTPEITMEVNPGTINARYLKNLKKSGVNRLNIGIQSFQDKNLKYLGRIHSAEQAEKAVEYSQDAGFKNTGIDLIYGLPDQSMDNWINDLNHALSYKLQHLSCYMLTFEKNTPLYKNYEQGLTKPLTSERLASFFQKTSKMLTKNGFIHYEISNFASSMETRSKHNRKYWKQVPYMGLGASAHSYDIKTRFWNHSDIKKYIADLKKNSLPVAQKEVLTETQKTIEMIMLGLRTMEGIRIKKHDNHFNDIIKRLEKDGLGKKEQGRFYLTRHGMCFLDNITQMFVDLI